MVHLDFSAAVQAAIRGATFFAEHGWWVSPLVLTEADLEGLDFGIERFYAGDVDWRLPAVPPGDSLPTDAPSATRQNDYVSLQVSEVRSFVLHPMLGALASAIGAHSGVRLFHDQLIRKPPDAGKVGWHTDRSYWMTCSSTEMLTVWIPLQDVGAENGSLQVLDRSHRWDLDHNDLRGFHDSAGAIPTFVPGGQVETLEMRRGQVSVHHARTLHASGRNPDVSPRTAIAVHMQPLENKYVPAPGDAPALHFNDVLCRRGADGYPDYSDPHVCPKLWPIGINSGA